MRRLTSAILSAVLLAGVPLVLAATIGSPLPSRWPDAEQLRAWLAQPLTEQTIVATVKALAWLLWLAVAATGVVDGIGRVRRLSRRLARLPLPTPWQATATGMAGAAVLGTGTAPAIADQPALDPATAAADMTAGHGQPPATPESAPAVTAPGVNLPGGGWLPGEVADAVAAATAFVWLRRRRDYQPRPPQLDPRTDPDLAGTPPAVAAVLAARHAPTESAGTHIPGGVADRAAVPLLQAHQLPLGGVGLTGPGAADAARGLLVTTLLAGPPAYRSPLVTTAVDLAVLFGPTVTRLGPVPGLHVGDSIAAALTALASDPNEPSADDVSPGPIVVLTHAPPDRAGQQRLTAALAPSRSAIRLVTLGPFPTAMTWEVGADGSTRPADQTTAAGPRLCVLPPQAAADLLTLAADAALAPPRLADPPSPAPGDRRRTVTSPVRGHQDHAPHGLRLQVLGDLTASRSGVVVPIRRDAARQLVVYLAVHRDGATGRDLTGLLWPQPHIPALTQRLHTTISDLRRVLHIPATDPVVQRVGDRYRLHPDLDVDLWHLQDAVAEAATALTAADRARALHGVIDAYRGDLAAQYDWAWLAPLREALRRHAIDAYIALAVTVDEPHAALALLQDALRIDPLNEALHHHAIHALTATGQPSAAADLLERYTARLAEAGLTPTKEFQRLAAPHPAPGVGA